MNNTNIIDASAYIDPIVKLGNYNKIGKNVKIEYVGRSPETVVISLGDNNIINDNTRILIDGNFEIGDWNVFHNDMLIMSGAGMKIGHNGWFGQNTILDGSGGLTLGNGVRIGMYSQIWTHVASGEQIEGCTLFGTRETVIEDDVWLVGSCIVGSGLHLGRRSISLINSVLTKNTEANKVYAGSPAKEMSHLNFYTDISLEEKMSKLSDWLESWECVAEGDVVLSKENNDLVLKNNNAEVRFTDQELNETNATQGSVFSVKTKTFYKTNNELERKVYKYLYNNKARFIPV